MKFIPASFKLFLRAYGLLLLLIIICLVVVVRNYSPNTYLTGWDTLHPEFNFKVYWSRMLQSVWQEHQGLGSVASQAHASEIPRVIILQILDVFLPVNMLRYAYAFLMLILGPVGVYLFLSKVFLYRENATNDANGFIVQLSAFIGGLFYLFNLSTLQHFYTPLEMFLTHYGLLPWILLFATLYFTYDRKQYLILFWITSFFIIPQSHTPTLFYVYFGALFLYLTPLVLAGHNRRKTTQAVVLLVSTLILNAFWFLPHLYFVFNHGTEISQSKIHHLFSEEAFLQNQEFGHIRDIALLKNFLFNWGEYVGNGRFGELLDEWKLHLTNPRVLFTGYTYFVLVIVGGFLAVLKKNKYALSVLMIGFLSLFFLLNNNPPFGPIFQYLQNTWPLFKEVFRLPFTKFSIILSLTYAVLFAYSVKSLVELLSDQVFHRRHTLLILVIYFLTAYSLFFYARPMLTGNLISPSMRVAIPSRYFALFDYMREQTAYGRVANLPIHTFWGWVYYDWEPKQHTGYQGAGFLWFGIKQPLLDREFDRWDILNESYYREMSQAIYSEDIKMFEDTLNKYKIRWILLDKSVISPGNDALALFYPQIIDLLSKADFIALEKDFGDGLQVYRYKPADQFKGQEQLSSFVYSNDSIFKEYDDPIYAKYGNYAVAGSKNYPYLGITNYTENINGSRVSSDAQNVYLTSTAGENLFVDKEILQYEASIEHLVGRDVLKIEPVLKNAGFIRPPLEIPLDLNADGDYAIVINGELPIVYNSKNTSASSDKYFFYANTANPVKISLYRLDILLGDQLINYTPYIEKCSGVEGGSAYGIEYMPGGFTLLSKDIVTCVTLRLNTISKLKSKPPMLVVKADISAINALPNICIFETVSGLCMNSSLNDGTAVSLLDSNPKKDYLIRFLSHALGKDITTDGKVRFSNIVFYTGELVSEKEVELHTTQQTYSSMSLTFRKDPTLSGNAAEFLSLPRICNTGSRNFESSQVTNNGTYVTYDARGESLCDSFQFPHASHNIGYVLEVTARNVYGMPLRVCLTNEYSKRCDQYVSLGTSTDFEKSYFLIPPMNVGKGYTVNISNLVFGEGKSKNDLRYVALTPVPYDFLRTLHSAPQKSTTEKMLVLNEAFENGWVALCGYKTCNAKHVMVNNWANGWIFENGEIPPAVQVVFVPQFLQYFGFLLLPLLWLFTLL